jgi:uncharacterized membrane protein
VQRLRVEIAMEATPTSSTLPPDTDMRPQQLESAPSQVTRNVQTVAALEARSGAQRSALDRFSDRVSGFASSTAFLLIHVVWFAGWITANVAARNPVDPYPFTFLTFLVSLEAIFLTSFVLISQNHLEAQAHRRAALDLQINLLAEREMTSVLRMVSAIAAHLGLSDECDDDELKELIEKTDLGAIVKTVEDHATSTAGLSHSSPVNQSTRKG